MGRRIISSASVAMTSALDSVTIYAICFCGIFISLFLVASIAKPGASVAVQAATQSYRHLMRMARFLQFSRVLNRHAFLGPWMLFSVLIHIMYVSGNIVSLWFAAGSVQQATALAGRLALINMTPLYLSTSLSFLADLFGIGAAQYKHLHRACGLTALALVVFHCALPLKVGFTMDFSGKLYAFIGSAIILVQVILCTPMFRRHLYETFLRSHQLLSIAFVFCTIKHLLSVEVYYWRPVYMYGSLCGVLAALQCVLVLYRNKQLGHAWPRLSVVNRYGNVEAVVQLSRPTQVEAGQYIYIWVPSVSLFSTHPFVVSSWSPEPQREMQLFIEKRQGFTQDLLNSAGCRRRVLFSGPHGRSLATVWDAERVLLFATDFGIVAMMPYLRKLTHESHKGPWGVQRFHLVWQVYNFDLRKALNPIITELLNAEIEGDRKFRVSIYSGLNIEAESSRHGRYTIYPGLPDIRAIVSGELRLDGLRLPKSASKTLMLIAVNNKMRDELRQTAVKYIRRDLELVELDFQPDH